MARWFRMHETVIDDPKVQRLPDALFKAWVNLLCLACRHDGTLPPIADVAFALRKSEREVDQLMSKLAAAELFDVSETGVTPHNWNGRQYLSDSPNERVKKYRDKRRASGLPILGDYTKFKAALIARDGDRCVYCEASDKLVVDHMVPIAMGGTDAEDNLALACKPCNSGKAGRTPELASMTIRVTTASLALARYRDNQRDVTVSETPSETETEQKERTDRAAPSGRTPDEKPCPIAAREDGPVGADAHDDKLELPSFLKMDIDPDFWRTA